VYKGDSERLKRLISEAVNSAAINPEDRKNALLLVRKTHEAIKKIQKGIFDTEQKLPKQGKYVSAKLASPEGIKQFQTVLDKKTGMSGSTPSGVANLSLQLRSLMSHVLQQLEGLLRRDKPVAASTQTLTEAQLEELFGSLVTAIKSGFNKVRGALGGNKEEVTAINSLVAVIKQGASELGQLAPEFVAVQKALPGQVRWIDRSPVPVSALLQNMQKTTGDVASTLEQLVSS
jgi:hypothetical protein